MDWSPYANSTVAVILPRAVAIGIKTAQSGGIKPPGVA